MRIIVLFVLIFLEGYTNQFNCNAGSIVQADLSEDWEDKYWIDFRFGFDEDTVSLKVNNELLVDSRILSTGTDGSDFTGLRIIYGESDDLCGFKIGNKVVTRTSCNNSIDSLTFDVKINSTTYNLSRSLDSCKVFFVSYAEEKNRLFVDKNYSFFSYQ